MLVFITALWYDLMVVLPIAWDSAFLLSILDFTLAVEEMFLVSVHCCSCRTLQYNCIYVNLSKAESC